jgi:hypothetical protein
MKSFILLLFMLASMYSLAQETRESDLREMHNEIPDDPYVAPDNHSKRIRSTTYRSISASQTISSIVTTQVNIDAQGNNITLDAANEPNIAISPINPNNIVIGWRQFDNVISNFRQAGYSYSSDGGITWAAGNVIEPGIFHSDPVLDCDSAGNFYYNSLGHDSLGNFLCYVFKSTNNGASWDSGTYANGGDKQWMVIDKSGSGINNNYSFWTTAYSSCVSNNFTRSTNGGLSFEPCSFVPGDFMWGTMDIDDNGALYTVGVGGVSTSRDSIIVSKSAVPTAGGPGLLWDTKNVFMDGMNVFSSSINPDGLFGQMNIAADHNPSSSGNIYVAGSLTRISFFDEIDVMFCRSTDGGQTWDPFIRINDDISTSVRQWLATMSVAPNGRIDVVWLDNRMDAGSDNSALFYSYSYDQGNTWSANEKLSQDFDPHIGYPAQNKMGDYFDMISDDVSAHLAWTNTLNGEEDVYYSVITPPSPTALAELQNPPVTVYPNPTSGFIKISSLANINLIEIYSLTGSRLMSKQISKTSADLDLGLLSNGVYFLNVKFDNGANSMKKIILNSIELK